MNNIHDKVFACPKCTNKTLYPVNGNEDIVGIGYHKLCICDECGAEFNAGYGRKGESYHGDISFYSKDCRTQ